MGDDPAASESASDEAVEDEAPEDDGDWLLAIFVRAANRGASVSVTLSVGGSIVSGMLVGAAEYLEGLGAEFEATDMDDKDKMGDMFREMAVQAREEWSPENDEQTDDYVVSYIHLKDARYLGGAGGYMPSNRGLWWRGRLDKVDGWSFGSLDVQKSSGGRMTSW
jgi:hypothetical protein